ncbi:hypothetical protein OV079_23910 [Nannocystis pusilla]|uniref:Uncharacterized protein n=1 Tax=Nannocystis pusilla TaxID=889268 RepID=A0A9X3IZG3_9BACT|nr:hypothetical protein [Nannocystis pusilla]MCY1008549.1 hypothetical protein [Nannocystis pusilla]
MTTAACWSSPRTPASSDTPRAPSRSSITARSPIGTPREAATHLRRAADLVATQLAETPVLEWGPHREPTPSSATPAPEAN